MKRLLSITSAGGRRDLGKEIKGEDVRDAYVCLCFTLIVDRRYGDGEEKED